MNIGIFKDVTKGDVLRYMLMPQVASRVNSFYQDGFASLAYLIALVYRAVNILPQNHYVLQPKNRNQIGIRMVMAAAAGQITFNIKNIDKVIIYFAIMLGMVLLGGQFFLTLGYLMVNPAMAAMPTTYGDFFAVAGPADIAYRLLWTVFGIPDLFSVGAAGDLPALGGRSQYHVALHALFQLYSVGLLVVAVIIICYFVFAILAETAQTGVPFGKRYDHVWVPIRLVFALGLLIPIGFGLNASQWITLYAAKLGSDFANQGWTIFNDTMTEAMLANPEERVGRPQTPQIMDLAAFMMTVLACQWSYETLYTGANYKLINAYLVKDPAYGAGQNLAPGFAGFAAAREYFNNGDIIIRFGERNASIHSGQRGFVYPYCGEMILFAGDTEAQGTGTYYIQQYFYALIYHIYAEGGFGIRQAARDFVDKYRFTDPKDPAAPLPEADFKLTLNEQLTNQMENAVTEAVRLQGLSPAWLEGMAEIRALGWAGAGVWYNKIAQINGALVTAVSNVPKAVSMPSVMEYVKREQLQQNQNNPEPFSTSLSDGTAIQFNSELDRDTASVLSFVYEYWSREDLNQTGQARQTNNILIDVINGIFGTRGLFDMCASADTHPLAQLSILGKGLIEASIRNIGMAAGLSMFSLVPYIGTAAGAASKILLSVSSITISLGFMLFYVVPFMPFLYFFFAVGGWVKGIFEAMVGAPLWALAHLRIDGEGLPGDAAMKGIYMIFEIFLRPILIIFGLLASFVIFSAMVKVLNEIFSLVVTNLAGHDPNATAICGRGTGSTGIAPGETPISYMRGPIDELFYTVIYAIIVYMIGMSCFKLIDLIPNNILRYMGADVKTFNDTAEDPTQGMMGRLGIGTSMVSNRVISDVGGGAMGAVGNTMRAGTELASPPAQTPTR